MLLNFVGKNIELTESLKNVAEKKFSKLDKYFSEEAEARVVFSTVREQQTVEVTIFLPKTIIRAEETTDDMYSSMDNAVDALARQIRKHKTKLKRRYQNNETIRFDEIAEKEKEETENKIVKRKNFELSPMNEEEAILQMELLNHNFFVFLDADTETVSIVYKRKDGNYGKIEV
ncbi:ribosome hibernation-promoting factor, HPF/YfiA family [uncultured Peptoniphilus sp.]|uniref:ribosome hibernation-promoting factor, HPF/YfiA family n=1 Tax=uncultured Peptoniphilus sp. TaxID=254354 RepID=UPI00258CAEF5|nr:ribosome-associated translation inhibitor RaiA [uncultured Peptoniphilus sp.]MDU5570851.1 ribosome-associated translation inhibitor RaiA [Peptoniphilus harei]MDU6783991.1 ribosome-associated translation inhibitor RaiA [Peptoniphilus harei]